MILLAFRIVEHLGVAIKWIVGLPTLQRMRSVWSPNTFFEEYYLPQVLQENLSPESAWVDMDPQAWGIKQNLSMAVVPKARRFSMAFRNLLHGICIDELPMTHREFPGPLMSCRDRNDTMHPWDAAADGCARHIRQVTGIFGQSLD